MGWLKENVPQFVALREKFVQEQGFLQAHIMHDGTDDFDKNFSAFYNYKKLEGNPLLIEIKGKYTIDDVYVVCHKTGYPLNEAIQYCTEDGALQHRMHLKLQADPGAILFPID